MSADHLKPVEDQIAALRHQRAVLAEFGEHALRTNDLDSLLQEAAGLVSEALALDLVKVLELLPEEGVMLLRAGVNWKPGLVGSATLGVQRRSPGGYALHTGEPVISPDVSTETRFEIPDILREHGVKSMVNVVIRGEREAFGILEVDSREFREFDEDDVAFLRTYANLMAAAIDRLKTQERLQEVSNDREVLMRELNHRIKNMLVNIETLCRQTHKGTRSKDEFAQVLMGRIDAQIRSQNVLHRGSGSSLTLDELLRLELAARSVQEEKDYTLHGPTVRLPPRCAQAMIMTIHELATNAVKYGALSTERGALDISWTTEERGEGRHLQFRWRERGIELGKAGRKGFGTRMIERYIPHMVGGTARLEFHGDGAECLIGFPLADPE